MRKQVKEEVIHKKMLLELGFEPISEHETDGYTHKDLKMYKLKLMEGNTYGFIFQFSSKFTKELKTIWEVLDEKDRIINEPIIPANQHG